MTGDELQEACTRFLRKLKDKGKEYVGFDNSFKLLQELAASNGLENEDLGSLSDIITNSEFAATKLIGLIKCLVPRYKMPEEVVKSMIIWFLSSVNKLPLTVSKITIEWIVGLWDYQLIDRKIINIYHDVLFYVMLKKGKLEKYIARLIYVLTKPEDVTRRDVNRLLKLSEKYTKPQRHIIALLSLFKSYKPELVPEKIQSMNIDSAWRPIPDALSMRFREARDRVDVNEAIIAQAEHFKWSTIPTGRKKNAKPLLPSVGYFHLGSSIFKENNVKSVFDISSMEQLGKSHFSIELPANAVSLLSNMAGYHLLTFSDFQYQSRFSFNLYNTLVRAFILENGKFSAEDMDKLLEMTVEFSRYMQQGILVINLFFDDYLYYNTGEHQSKLLALLQWMISVSKTELQEKILVHVQNIFYESTLSMKCEIIETLRKLISNLFINQGFNEYRQSEPAPFLGHDPTEKIEDVIPVITKVTGILIVNGLNIHSHDIVFLSVALSFYEAVHILEKQSSILSVTIAPSAVIYSCLFAGSCAILSRVCKLLSSYRDMALKLKARNLQSTFENDLILIAMYMQDFAAVLWNGELFSKELEHSFLESLPKKMMEDIERFKLGHLLNIRDNYAFLPYKTMLSKTELRKAGLSIKSKEDALTMAALYYPAVSELLSIFHL